MTDPSLSPAATVTDLSPVVLGVVFSVVSAGSLLPTAGVTGYGVLLSMAPGLIILGSGVAIYRSSVPTERHPRITAWGVGGLAVIGAVTAVLVIDPSIEIDSLPSVVAGLGVGAAIGLLAGFHEARAIQRGRAAERQRLRAADARAENAQLEHVNKLLRHDIANYLQVVHAHTELLEAEAPDRTRHHTETIQQQVLAIEGLVENVQTYLQSLDGAPSLRPVDLTATLRSELSTLEESYPEVTTTADVPAGATVRADSLLGSVFGNLLRNAVVHNHDSNPAVSVSVQAADGTYLVAISDNGSGIPDHERDSLFTSPAPGDSGFGLYLVRRLVDRYGGSLSVTSSSDEGTTITVALPQGDT